MMDHLKKSKHSPTVAKVSRPVVTMHNLYDQRWAWRTLYGSEGLSSHPDHPEHPQHPHHPHHPHHHHHPHHPHHPHSHDHVDQAGGERSNGGKGVSTLPSLSLTNVCPSTKVRIDIRKIIDKIIIKKRSAHPRRSEEKGKKDL